MYGLTGLSADCEQTQQSIHRIEEQYRSRCESLSAGQLAFKLSDGIHAALLTSRARVMAVNALVIDRPPMKETIPSGGVSAGSSFGQIYKVDLSTNVHRCSAVCVGNNNRPVNLWLETRGVFVVKQLLQTRSDYREKDPYELSISKGLEVSNETSICDCLDKDSTFPVGSVPINASTADNSSVIAGVGPISMQYVFSNCTSERYTKD